ncbi:MAG TPA: sensor domain-containing diguanylate cyclase [Anaerolineales bacterium]|nr:sensor domain-containing diguanylate cyclase [Anaerolineales bacterium]
MKSRRSITAFSAHEVGRFIVPASVAIMLLMALIAVDGVLVKPKPSLWMIFYALGGITHTLIYITLVTRSVFFREIFIWTFSITSGITLGLLPYALPSHLTELFHMLVVLGVIAVTIGSGRPHAWLTLLTTFFISLPGNIQQFLTLRSTLEYIAPFVISVIATETLTRIKNTTRQHIHRLETINRVSRQLMLSLDTAQVLSMLNATILDTLEADSYFVGTLKGDNICLNLMYDEGEFFNGAELPIDGTLSGWVIKNQRELFLPDLREDVPLEGVKVRVIGKDKASLAWIGVPLKAPHITGIMAMASYRPNAFDLGDLELLSSLAQHVTLALDNSVRHAQVEEQARLDSLTGVYNHGYFLNKLAQQAEASTNHRIPLSLIMLDIDFFKQYNDTYGHLVGDQILTSLCSIIRQHIKQGDAVGRWGGEEFIISLPNATGEQALQVAKRIGESMAQLRVVDREQRSVPVPTVSQGIAVFPIEVEEIYRLIDLADRRLYVAKERGRNQIEPSADYWETIPVQELERDR